MENGNVSLKINDGIAEVEFSHPMSNSLPGKVLNKLAKMIEQVGNDDEVKVVILRSEGKRAFCGGASFDELAEIKDESVGKEFFMGFARVINAMRKCPKLIIARVQGRAVGGGVGLVASADYVFATGYSSVKLSELALGIGPFVVGPAVERKIGTAAFSAMSIDVDWYSPEWALEHGLYNQVFNNADGLDSELNQFADRLASGSAEAMAELKKVIWEGTENWDELLEQRAEISGKLVLSDFTKKYIADFKKK
jgi:enoyl-CoA hydratase/carnithine racemase